MPKSPEAPTPFMLEVPISPAVTSPPSSRTQRKSLGRKHKHKPKSTLPTLDLDATAQKFLKVVVDEDSDDEDYVDEVWSPVIGWEVLSTPLGEMNALYHIDGDLQVLFDSQPGGKGSSVWQNQHLWEIRSWRLERAEAQRKRQQEVLESAKFYNEDDWLNIRAQVEANATLSQTLLGDDVTEDNFPARMAALIKKNRQALAEQLFKERHNRPLTPAQQKAYTRQYVKNHSSAIYNTGWTMAYMKSFSDE
nr:hypothetical protein [Tanacetum cinerariifolium]